MTDEYVKDENKIFVKQETRNSSFKRRSSPRKRNIEKNDYLINEKNNENKFNRLSVENRVEFDKLSNLEKMKIINQEGHHIKQLLNNLKENHTMHKNNEDFSDLEQYLSYNGLEPKQRYKRRSKIISRNYINDEKNMYYLMKSRGNVNDNEDYEFLVDQAKYLEDNHDMTSFIIKKSLRENNPDKKSIYYLYSLKENHHNHSPSPDYAYDIGDKRKLTSTDKNFLSFSEYENKNHRDNIISNNLSLYFKRTINPKSKHKRRKFIENNSNSIHSSIIKFKDSKKEKTRKIHMSSQEESSVISLSDSDLIDNSAKNYNFKYDIDCNIQDNNKLNFLIKIKNLKYRELLKGLGNKINRGEISNFNNIIKPKRENNSLTYSKKIPNNLQRAKTLRIHDASFKISKNDNAQIVSKRKNLVISKNAVTKFNQACLYSNSKIPHQKNPIYNKRKSISFNHKIILPPKNPDYYFIPHINLQNVKTLKENNYNNTNLNSEIVYNKFLKTDQIEKGSNKKKKKELNNSCDGNIILCTEDKLLESPKKSQKTVSSQNANKILTKIKSNNETKIPIKDEEIKINSLQDMIVNPQKIYESLSHKEELNNRHLIKNLKVYDSLSEDDNKVNIHNKIFINPNSYGILLFDFILLVIVTYSIIYLPIRTIFMEDIDLKSITLEIICDLLFLFDFLISFILAYYDFEENLITSNRKILMNYLRSYFFLDLVCAIPFNTFIEFMEYFKKYDTSEIFKYSVNDYEKFKIATNYMRVLNLTSFIFGSSLNNHASTNSIYDNIFISDAIQKPYQFLSAYNYMFSNNYNKLYRILKLMRILKVLKHIQKNTFINKVIDSHYLSFITDSTNYKLLLYYFNFLVISHILTCLFIFFGTSDFPNWITKSGMQDSTFLELYLSSLYFNHLTIFTVGYGDIISKNNCERIYNMILMVLGVMLYSFALSKISNMIKENEERSKIFEQKTNYLMDLYFKYDLSENLHGKILRHLKYQNKLDKTNKNDLLNELPMSLRNDIIVFMNKTIIENFIFFKDLKNNEFIIQVIMCMKPTNTIRNEILLKEGDFIEEIIMIKHGTLSLTSFFDFDYTKYYQRFIEKFKNKSFFNNLKGNFRCLGSDVNSPQKRNLNFNSNSNNNLASFLKNSNNLSGRLRNFNSRSTAYNYNQFEGNYFDKKERQEEHKNSAFNLINKKDEKNLDIKNFINEQENPIVKKNYVNEYERILIKILVLRKNDYFGDYLMIEHERSPLTIKTKSKTSELLLLDRNDVIRLSHAYTDCFEKIYFKSTFNMKQIKKKIKQQKKLSEFLKVKKIKNMIKKQVLNFNSNSNKKSLHIKQIKTETPIIKNIGNRIDFPEKLLSSLDKFYKNPKIIINNIADSQKLIKSENNNWSIIDQKGFILTNRFKNINSINSKASDKILIDSKHLSNYIKKFDDHENDKIITNSSEIILSIDQKTNKTEAELNKCKKANDNHLLPIKFESSLIDGEHSRDYSSFYTKNIYEEVPEVFVKTTNIKSCKLLKSHNCNQYGTTMMLNKFINEGLNKLKKIDNGVADNRITAPIIKVNNHYNIKEKPSLVFSSDYKSSKDINKLKSEIYIQEENMVKMNNNQKPFFKDRIEVIRQDMSKIKMFLLKNNLIKASNLFYLQKTGQKLKLNRIPFFKVHFKENFTHERNINKCARNNYKINILKTLEDELEIIKNLNIQYYSDNEKDTISYMSNYSTQDRTDRGVCNYCKNRKKENLRISNIESFNIIPDTSVNNKINILMKNSKTKNIRKISSGSSFINKKHLQDSENYKIIFNNRSHQKMHKEIKNFKRNTSQSERLNNKIIKKIFNKHDMKSDSSCPNIIFDDNQCDKKRKNLKDSLYFTKSNSKTQSFKKLQKDSLLYNDDYSIYDSDKQSKMKNKNDKQSQERREHFPKLLIKNIIINKTTNKTVKVNNEEKDINHHQKNKKTANKLKNSTTPTNPFKTNISRDNQKLDDLLKLVLKEKILNQENKGDLSSIMENTKVSLEKKDDEIYENEDKEIFKINLLKKKAKKFLNKKINENSYKGIMNLKKIISSKLNSDKLNSIRSLRKFSLNRGVNNSPVKLHDSFSQTNEYETFLKNIMKLDVSKIEMNKIVEYSKNEIPNSDDNIEKSFPKKKNCSTKVAEEQKLIDDYMNLKMLSKFIAKLDNIIKIAHT